MSRPRLTSLVTQMEAISEFPSVITRIGQPAFPGALLTAAHTAARTAVNTLCQI